ncbi:hypothetical protein F4860DRAFT_493801 [Xylaria cubensis]|nr:hypothetical protein F4860DRAFT_493801 [Xylaria cubensis]
MNPLDAISLAAAVVQFTDFGVRLLSETVQVYKSVSGMASQTVELKTIEDDLRQLSHSIQEKSAQLADPIKPPRESEKNLLRLCRTCQELSTELATAVSRLRTHSSGRINLAVESFGVAVRKFKSRDDITDLRSRVFEVRQQMMLAMTVFLWEESKSRGDDLDQLSRRQVDMINTLTRIDDTTRNLNQTLIMFLQGSIPIDLRQREIIETIWSPSWSLEQPIQDIDREDVEFLTDDSNTNNDAACSKAILQSLFLEDLRYREGAIPEAYESTFKWLLESPRSDIHGQPLWSDFPTWLRSSDSDIYWVTGKPGSGKSTLMKFITSHDMLQNLLVQWSKPKPFIVARFYFWNAGTTVQRTQEGLLRTLLHQCLRQHPQLIRKACPRRWALFKVFGLKAKTAVPPWALEELLESFSAFDKFVGQQFNLALFIDGLDEFDGDHKTLLEFVRLFHSRAGRKVCVSSRPWNVFQDAFTTSPSLRLERLTEGDTRLYVQGNLDSNLAFQEHKDVLPQRSGELVETIVTKAQGVFLWVSVVVRLVLEGLSEGDRWEEIHDMIDALPDDLSQLYQRIWSTINPNYISQSSHLFQIHRAYVGLIDDITLWLADHPDPLKLDTKEIHRYITGEERDVVTQTLRRRLNSRTRGLLELSSHCKVEFLHRSVRDWIEPIWDDIVAKSNPAFDPNLCILKAQTVIVLSHLVRDSAGSFQSSERVIDKSFFLCLYYAGKVHDIASNKPTLVATLDQLYDEIQEHWDSFQSLSTVRLGQNRDSFQSLNPGESRQNRGVQVKTSFLGLVAQFGVLGYVRDKVSVNPQLLQRRRGEISILANAILGSDCLSTFRKPYEDYSRMEDYELHRHGPDSTHTRFLLIKFLLGQNVAKSSAILPGIPWNLYDEARSKPVEMPPIIMPNGEQLDYWETVADLLKKRGFSKVGAFRLKIKPHLLKWLSLLCWLTVGEYSKKLVEIRKSDGSIQ